jgi:hypothetical protein
LKRKDAEKRTGGRSITDPYPAESNRLFDNRVRVIT